MLFCRQLSILKRQEFVFFSERVWWIKWQFPCNILSMDPHSALKFTSSHPSFSLRLSSKIKQNCGRRLSSTGLFGLHWHLFQNHPELSMQAVFSSMSDLDLWENVSYTIICWAALVHFCSLLVLPSVFCDLKILLNTKFNMLFFPLPFLSQLFRSVLENLEPQIFMNFNPKQTEVKRHMVKQLFKQARGFKKHIHVK